MSPEPLPETGVLTNQIANFVNGRRRTLWLFNVDSFPQLDCSSPDRQSRALYLFALFNQFDLFNSFNVVVFSFILVVFFFF